MNTGATNRDPGVAKGNRPPLFLLVSEVRAVAELTATLATMPALLRAPRGDGHPVLVIPGFLAGDVSTVPLRRYLAATGYNVHPWRLGRNTGGVSRMVSAVQSRIAEIRQATNRKVSLIGWSLGGVYARLATGKPRPRALRRGVAGDLPVPTTAIYSKTDGIVNWRSSALVPNHQSENIERS